MVQFRGYSPFTTDLVPVPTSDQQGPEVWLLQVFPARWSWDQLLHLIVIPLPCQPLSAQWLVSEWFPGPDRDSSTGSNYSLLRNEFSCVWMVLTQHLCDAPFPVCSCIHKDINASLG